ncbi:LysR family transcriptional regulator [Vibrio sp. SCSIO 43135]|nr:LysR family transcriptional regulator [Vibrio sp. SCSIO 43135]USD43132.1 LysR family transcriptional regulator [Vibrio sp. SCSIO 43135]
MIKGSEYPSHKALRTFISVANSLSFSQAAQELCVTQSAVSKQIASLELQLGQALFERHANGITLTVAGKHYLPKVTEALEAIQYATASVLQSGQAQGLLRVNVTPSFANLWLIPNIRRFHQTHSKLQVSVTTGDGQVKESLSNADIMVRCLPLSKHYDNAHLLCEEELVLTAEANTKNIESIDELAKLSFIPQITRPQLWEQLRYELGLEQDPTYYPVGFEHFYLTLETLKKEGGLALLPRFMVNSALEEETLSNPMRVSFMSGYGYYLIVPNYRMASRPVYDFVEWLKSEFELK